MYRNHRSRLRSTIVVAAGLLVAGVMLAGVLGLVRDAAASVASGPPYTEWVPQPEDQNSNLPAAGGDTIWDREFVYYITSTLGITNCQSMVFVFGQCFGGGMIDELARAGISCTLSAQSASRHNQCSWGSASEDFYLRALAQSLAMSPTQPISTAAGEAAKNDPTGPNGANPLENPQVYGSGPNSQTVAITGAQSFHAILFAGNPNGARHWGDLVRIYNLLTSTYGYTAGQIHVLYDNGQWPTGRDADGDPFPPNPGITVISATRRNLTQTLGSIATQMNPNEQFFWWSSDHGGSGVAPTSTLTGGRGNGSCNSIDGQCQIPMERPVDPADFWRISQPTLDFEFQVIPQFGPPPPLMVCFNTFCPPQPFIATGLQRVRLPLSPSALLPHNLITFTIAGDPTAQFVAQVQNVYLDFGGLTTQRLYAVLLPVALQD